MSPNYWGYFISNRYGWFGDVQNPQKGHQSQPLLNNPGSIIPNSNPKKLSEVMNKINQAYQS